MSHRRTLPISPFSLLSHNTQSKVVLTWVRRRSPLYSLLSTNILREICQFFTPRPLLADSDVAELTVFSPLTKELRKIELRQVGIQLDYQFPGRCVCIGSEDVYLCGGMIRTAHTKQCAPSTFAIECGRLRSLCDMHMGRYWHGLYYHEDSHCVFAFGGICNLWYFTKSCERYDISTDCWSPLPDMRRAIMNIATCGHREKVYICGHGSTHLDVFSAYTEEFTVAPIEISGSWSNFVPAVWGNKLIVSQNGNMKVFDGSTYALAAEFTVPVVMSTRCRVVVNDVLFCLERGKNISIDLIAQRTINPSP